MLASIRRRLIPLYWCRIQVHRTRLRGHTSVVFICRINYAVQDLVGHITAVFILTYSALSSIFTLQRFVYTLSSLTTSSVLSVVVRWPKLQFLSLFPSY